MHTGKSGEQRLPRPSTTMKPRRAISLVPLMTCVEIASEHVKETVQSQAWCENASQEAEDPSSGSKAELSLELSLCSSLCRPRRPAFV